SQLTLIAVPWFVLQTTGSAARTGFTGFFSLLPLLIGGVFGGLIVDRLGFRRASILADLGSGLMVALVPLLYHTVGLAYWQLLVLGAASFVISALIVTVAVPRSGMTIAADTQAADDQAAGLRAGFDFIRRDRVLLALILTGTAFNFFGAPFGGVILPVYANRVL